jgi:hypothetical protein
VIGEIDDQRRVDAVTCSTAVPGRRRLLAAAILAQPLLIAVNGTFHPEVDMDAASMLAGAAEDATSWYAVHLIAALGALLGAPAAFGLRSLLRQNSPMGDVALVVAVVAAIVLGLSFMAEASVLRLAVTADLDGAARLALTDEYLSAPELYAVGVGVLGAGVATALFSVAILLERRVPRWMPTATIAGTAVALGAQPGTALAPLAFGVVTIAAVGLARHVVQAPPMSPTIPHEPAAADVGVHPIHP